jgi:hypothetical protein
MILNYVLHIRQTQLAFYRKKSIKMANRPINYLADSTIFFVGKINSEDSFYKMTNKMQQRRIIYCSLVALHVSSNISAHHQEHLNCNYNFWFYSRVSLSAAACTAIPLPHFVFFEKDNNFIKSKIAAII